MESEAYKHGEFVDLDKIVAEADAIGSISDEIARMYGALPIMVKGNKLYTVMGDPTNIRAIDDIRFITQKTVVPLRADPTAINRKIDLLFSNQRSAKAIEDLKNETAKITPKTAPDSGDLANSPAVRLANSILEQSVTGGASDIHLEPYEDGVRVRYRVDGILAEKMTIPAELYQAVASRIKILAGMDIAERRLPQDGRIDMAFEGDVYDFRVSTLPTVYGEKVEIRKLDRQGFTFDRKKLSFTEKENRILDKTINTPRGIILVTGPTGSGKTTTIYSFLRELNTVDKNIVTIEDPVEYMVRGINQVQVNNKAGLTFAGGLRSILRQDPDIVMIGEIRDEETAQIAVRASITGHLVLSTLHTNDAPGSIARLMDMGVEPYLLSEAIACVIAQRLVRRLCGNCKAGRQAGAAESELLKAGGQTVIYDPVGCSMCNGTGYRGRRAIHEVFFVNSEIKRHIDQNDGIDILRDAAVRAGMTTLRDDCVKAVLEGATSIHELMNTVYAGEMT